MRWKLITLEAIQYYYELLTWNRKDNEESKRKLRLFCWMEKRMNHQSNKSLNRWKTFCYLTRWGNQLVMLVLSFLYVMVRCTQCCCGCCKIGLRSSNDWKKLLSLSESYDWQKHIRNFSFSTEERTYQWLIDWFTWCLSRSLIFIILYFMTQICFFPFTISIFWKKKFVKCKVYAGKENIRKAS